MRFSAKIVVAVIVAFLGASTVRAEDLPEIRPALIGSGPGSLINLIDAQALFQKGQRDAWVMFECAVLGDGIASGGDFFTASPNSNLLQNEIRIYANQDLDEIKRGADFVAPQMIDVPTNYYLNFPKTPTAAVRDDAAGVVKVRHSVDANGKTTNVEVISEPAGSQTGEYLKKALPRLDFTPGYRNGRPTAATYTFTWWFGRVVGR